MFNSLEKARMRETERQVVKVEVFTTYVWDFALGTRFYRSILDNVVANFQNNKIKTLITFRHAAKILQHQN